jgi:RimJ/RimL family protein N-acetyltransferase
VKAYPLPGSNLYVCPDDSATFQLLRSHLGLQHSEDFRGVMFVRPEKLQQQCQMSDIGVAYGWHGFIGRMCIINILVQDKTCLTRAVIREAFRFPFEEANCSAILSFTDSANEESIDLTKRAGFEHVLTIPNGGLEGDMLMFKMARDRCRWLRKVH